MTQTTALGHAAWIYAHIDQYDKQQRFDAAVALGEWKVFSLRQIARITGLAHTTVAQLVKGKTEKTGGKFDPEALSLLVELSKRRHRSEPLEPADVRAALNAGAGTSPYMAARLTDIPRTHLIRRYNAAKGEAA